MTMINELMQDCKDWISDLTEVMRNEREMQVRLAMYLKEKGHYDNVHVEYTVPLQLLAEHNFEVPSKSEDDIWTTPENFPWHNQMYFDVMVEKDGRFAAVELKYATTYIKPQPLVFGEEVPNGVEIIKHQGAQNLVMYNYRKDIRRIEALKVFSNVIGGIALILTNDPIYWTKPYSSSGYFAFSTHEGNIVGPGDLKWGDNIGDTINGTHPNFVLDSGYNSNWNDVLNSKHNENTNLVGFRYLISVVSKSNDEIGNSVPLKMPNTNLLQIQNTEINMNYKINVIGKAQNATALGIMHAYLEIFPKSTLADLRRAFPGSIAPDRGVQEIFLPIKNAIKYNSQSDMSLYFTKENRPTLKLADGSEIAVCQIWTSASLANLVEVAKKYGIKAEVNKEVEIGKFGYNIIKMNMSEFSATINDFIITIDSDKSVAVNRTFDNTKAILREIAAANDVKVPENSTTQSLGRLLLKELCGGESVGTVGEYTIERDSNNHITVTRTYSNTKQGLREAAQSAGFEDPDMDKWNTRSFGKHLVDWINEIRK